jgi:hypothetical protein
MTADDTVARLVEIWAQLLEPTRVDEDTDFLEAGGTSLMAARIRGRIRTTFGRDVDLLDILDNATPRRLARVLDGARTEA